LKVESKKSKEEPEVRTKRGPWSVSALGAGSPSF